MRHLKHFKGVDIPTIPRRDKIDILIGQTHKDLLVVLEEQEGMKPEDPNYVLTRLGPIASGGRTKRSSECCFAHKVVIANGATFCEGERLKAEISGLKECLRKRELENEIIKPSKNEELARGMVESKVKLVNGRYEIPAPLKPHVINKLVNNFHSTADRTLALRKTALKMLICGRFLSTLLRSLLVKVG